MGRLSWLGLLLLGLYAGAVMPAGCIAGATCVDGVLDEDGSCQAKCRASACVAGNTCIGNVCQPLCTSHTDCAPGVEDCLPATEDDTGKAILSCQSNGRQPVEVEGKQVATYGAACLNGDSDCTASVCPNGLSCNLDSCDDCELNTAACAGKDPCNIGSCSSSGQACVFNTCSDAECTARASACPNGLECDLAACADCALDEAACDGKDLCNIGRCAGSGERCTFNTCPAEQCTALTCLGESEGDAQAYCTHHDCADDSGCPTGFYCGITRDPHDICGPKCVDNVCSHIDRACETDGDCQTGNNNFCGQTEEPCIDIEAANANGSQYVEGDVCLLRRTCIKRDACAPCADNLDCSLGNGEVCAQHGPNAICARFCSIVGDCRLDEVCVPYVTVGGGEGKTCKANPNVNCSTADDCAAEGDECVERKVCVAASGSCDASTATGDKFCHHCADDLDCGGPSLDSAWACVEVGSGEFGCLDLAFPNACETDFDCPKSPGGRHGECLDEDDGVTASSSVYKRCSFPRCDGSDTANPCKDPRLEGHSTCN